MSRRSFRSIIPPPLVVRWAFALGGLFLVAMTLLRAGTYLVSPHGSMASGQVWAAFWLGLRFDARFVAGALCGLVVLGGYRRCNPFESEFARRFWIAVLTVFGAALVVLYTADFLHYHYLGQRLNASALGFLRDTGISAGMAWQSYPVVRIALGMAAGIAVLGAGIVVLHRLVGARAPETTRSGRIGWFTIAILLCVLGMFGRVGQYPLRWSDAFALRDDASAHLALNPVQSFFSSLDFRASSFDRARVRAHYPRMRAYLGPASGGRDGLRFERRLAPAANVTDVARPNVVLVLGESFSAYKSSMWGNPLNPTPFFARLCRDGVFFDNCFTPHFGTARGVWATLTGIPDVEPTKTASRNPALVDQHTIVNDFAGYERLYFLGGSSSWANIRGLLTNNIAGLQLHEEDSFKSPRVDVWGISDKSLFLEAHEVLRTQTRPFFAIIQTAGNHRPYTIPPEDRGEFALVERPAEELKRAGYESNAELNAFRYSDFAIGKFIEAARQADYFENTIFAFIGDHGIGGHAGTMFPPAWTEQNLTCYHVPLLFYAPKLLPAQRIHSVASMVDVLPTLAGMAGIEYHNTGLGRDLRRQQDVDGGASNVAFIIDQHSRTIGIVRGSWYGSLQLDGAREDFVWADFATLPPPPRERLRFDPEYREIANAFHETARYLLFNNRKRGGPGVAPYAGERIYHRHFGANANAAASIPPHVSPEPR